MSEKSNVTAIISVEEFKELNRQGRIHAKPHKPMRRKSTGNSAKASIELMLKLAGVDYVKEHVFSKGRKFRFDYAIPAKMIGIEYEGLMSEKSRHTTVIGFTRDTEKYNQAVKEGWRMLRYTVMNYTKLTDDLKELLNNKP